MGETVFCGFGETTTIANPKKPFTTFLLFFTKSITNVRITLPFAIWNMDKVVGTPEANRMYCFHNLVVSKLARNVANHHGRCLFE